MVNDKEQKDEVNPDLAESNAERDQDHGNMNNGTIGGNMGVIGPKEERETESPGSAEGDRDLDPDAG